MLPNLRSRPLLRYLSSGLIGLAGAAVAADAGQVAPLATPAVTLAPANASATHSTVADDGYLDDLFVGIPLNGNPLPVAHAPHLLATGMALERPTALPTGGYEFPGDHARGLRISLSQELQGAQTWTVWLRVEKADPPKGETPPPPMTILAGAAEGVPRAVLRLFNGRLEFGVLGGEAKPATVRALDPVPTGEWVCVAVRREPGAAPALFLNATPLATGVVDDGDWRAGVPLTQVRVGYSALEADPCPFRGQIRDARIFAKALSQEKLAEIAKAPTLRNGMDSADFFPIATTLREQNRYVGSPSIAKLPDGTFVVSHDYFYSLGSKGPTGKANQTLIYASKSKGVTWRFLKAINGAFWSGLFEHRGNLYLMGPDSQYGRYLVIRRSEDGGMSWTVPSGPSWGVISKSNTGFHSSPTAVIHHKGRIWKAYEDCYPATSPWPSTFVLHIASAPDDSDLLNAANWTISEAKPFERGWVSDTWIGPGWLEGNAVALPDGGVAIMPRVHSFPDGALSAIVRVSEDGKQLTFDPRKDFIRFPGGYAKFTVRYDPVSKNYFSIGNDEYTADTIARRYMLTLSHSPDAVQWTSLKTIVNPNISIGIPNSSFQYADWIIDGDDIALVSRTALLDARSSHDSNYLTFHRIRNFRQYLTSPEPALAARKLPALAPFPITPVPTPSDADHRLSAQDEATDRDREGAAPNRSTPVPSASPGS